MSSESVSLIADHPFVRRFVYAILQNIRAKGLVHEERYVIHADLVPKVSKKVMMSVMDKPRVLPKKPVVPPVVPVRRVLPKKVMPPVVPVRRVMPPRVPVGKVAPPKPQIAPPPVKGGIGLSQDYGKITPLLNDISVSTIECQGAGIPMMIVRAGRRQPTRIALNAGEIKDILEKVSDSVHIPILEGVFRAAVNNFSINAVVSEIIGSRFVIKKQTAYTMLEHGVSRG